MITNVLSMKYVSFVWFASCVPLFWGKRRDCCDYPIMGNVQYVALPTLVLSLSLTCEPHTCFTCYLLEGFVFLYQKISLIQQRKPIEMAFVQDLWNYCFHQMGNQKWGWANLSVLSFSVFGRYKWRTHPLSNRMKRPMSSSTSYCLAALLLYIFQQDLRWRCCTVWGQLVNLHINLAPKSRCQRPLVPPPFIF